MRGIVNNKPLKSMAHRHRYWTLRRITTALSVLLVVAVILLAAWALDTGRVDPGTAFIGILAMVGGLWAARELAK